jgi:hypothetical protein
MNRLLTLSFLLIALPLSGLPTSVQAQQLPFAMDVPTGVDSYDDSVPTPESVIGHVIGTHHTVPHQVEWYYRAVAEASDRVVFRTHGTTYEGRNLIHAVITTPANHARLDEILAAQQRVADNPDAMTNEMMSDMPVILHQGYSVHGNESSGTEAAVLYLYHLAAGQGAEIENQLENAVIILDPMYNPDGRDRFGDWVNRNRGGVATSDGQDREHNEPWPGGRTNHYWFDLNRDWMAAQHPESVGRMSVFHTWRPHILTDHHEMGGSATFFFQPGIPSRNNPNTPKLNTELTAEIATYHAAGLDEVGAAYYSEESFDDFFLGKGSAFPDVNGSIGILFEQGSSRALIASTSSGKLHYAYTVQNQFITSLTTLKAGVSMRDKLLRYQRDFYAEALEMARDADHTGWVLSLEDGRTRAQQFTQLMQRHRVQFHELTEDVTIDGVTVRAGNGYVVPAVQPQFRAIEAFTERSLTYEDSLFYDVSTWTLPLSFDVDWLKTDKDIEGIAGEAIESPVSLDGGAVTGDSEGVAYLIRWNRFFAPRTVNRLQEAGVPLRMANNPFSAIVDGEKLWFDRGTIIVQLERRLMPGEASDHSQVHDIIQTAVMEDHVEVYQADSGLTPDGPDLGGSSTSVLAPMRIALTAGSGASTYATGEAWHAISERFRMPVSLIEPARLAGLDLDRYNVIVLTAGGLSQSATDALKDWTRGGGTLIVMSAANRWAMSNELFDLEEQSVDMEEILENLSYDQFGDARGAQGIGGSIFEVDLDTTHPLAYGMPESLPVFRQGSTVYQHNGSSTEVVGAYSDEPLLSGYLSEEKHEQFPGQAAVLASGYGSGNVIFFQERLNFRAHWHGTQRLFFNALVFGGTF